MISLFLVKFWILLCSVLIASFSGQDVMHRSEECQHCLTRCFQGACLLPVKFTGIGNSRVMLVTI